MSERPTLSATNWLLIIILSVLWGGTFFLTKIAVIEIPTFALTFARVVIAAAFLGCVVWISGLSFPRGGALWRELFIMALFNNAIPFCLITWGQKYITAGLASILIATTPLFGAAIAHVVTHDERLNAPRIVGLMIGFLGVVVMIGPDLLRDLGTDVVAQLAVLASAVMYAGSIVYGRRFRHHPPTAIACGQLIAASFLLFIPTMVIDQPWSLAAPSMAPLLAMFGLGLLSTGVGFIIFLSVLARAGATNLMIVNFLNPVSAILLGGLFLGEILTQLQIVGMAAIAVGLAAIDGRPARWLGSTVRRAFSAPR
jgi:drug/metabolite transporter (DMT)-like permease